MSGDAPAPGGSSFPAGNADAPVMDSADSTTPVAQPLSAEEEKLLRFARSINGGLLDASPVETIDRLLAAPASLPVIASYDATTPAGLDELLRPVIDRALRIQQRARRAAISNEDWRYTNGFNDCLAAVLDILDPDDSLGWVRDPEAEAERQAKIVALASPEEPSGSSFSVKADPR